MLQANYHTHTKRCGHATGEDEEYVLEALGHGFKHLGFSDHAMLPDFEEEYIRGSYSVFPDYCESIRDLQKRYSGQMEIYLGLEAEAFLPYFPYYKTLLDSGVLDYLILGNHSAMNEKREIISRFYKINSASQLYLYLDLALQAISSGMFKIFAHPDYFLSSIEDFDADCKKVSKKIIEACIAYDVPLEVNEAGIRNGKKVIGSEKRWAYPTDYFFSFVSKYQAKCIIGKDAHAPDQLSDSSSEYLLMQFVKEHNLRLVDRLDSIVKH